jgi:hypothetical protein
MPRPGRRRQPWGLSPEIECLLDVARDERGGADEALLERQTALAEVPALKRRIQRGASVLEALKDVVEDARVYAQRVGGLTREVEAVAVLLNLGVPDFGDRNSRLSLACRRHLKGVEPSAFETGSRVGGRPDAPRVSQESQLFERFVTVANGLETKESSSRGVSRTLPMTRSSPARGTDLVGTWSGITDSNWLFKDDTEDRITPCYMVVNILPTGELDVRWYYRKGVSWSTATRLTAASDGAQRLHCAYEADTPVTHSAATPSHRGSCLLDISGGQVSGPYFTDRRTYGELRFDRHVTTEAEDYRHAAFLFGSRP